MKQPSLDGRFVAAAIIALYALGLVLVAGLVGERRVFEFAGVRVMGKSFPDLQIFPAAQAEIARGGDPHIESRSDPWRRPFNYPAVWLQFMRFPSEAVPWVGFSLGVLWLAGVGAWWGRLSILQGISGGLLLCGPPIVLALERGNCDLLVFLIVLGALVSLKHGLRGVAAMSFAVAGVLKLYPLAGVAVFRRLPLRGMLSWSTATAAIAGVFWLWHVDELRVILRATPIGGMLAYGAKVWVLNLVAPSSGAEIGDLGLLCRLGQSVALVGAALAFVFGYRHARTHPFEPAGWSLDGFRAGAAIYLLTFVAGANFSYRLMFLLLCVPWLMDFERAFPRGLSLPRSIALGLVAAIYWINPFWWAVLMIPREIAGWSLLVMLAWLLGATSRFMEKHA
ncbi:MAG: hypothetical protein AB1486_29790 [Planctomycetota bacterium]